MSWAALALALTSPCANHKQTNSATRLGKYNGEIKGVQQENSCQMPEMHAIYKESKKRRGFIYTGAVKIIPRNKEKNQQKVETNENKYCLGLVFWLKFTNLSYG